MSAAVNGRLIFWVNGPSAIDVPVTKRLTRNLPVGCGVGLFDSETVKMHLTIGGWEIVGVNFNRPGQLFQKEVLHEEGQREGGDPNGLFGDGAWGPRCGVGMVELG